MFTAVQRALMVPEPYCWLVPGTLPAPRMSSCLLAEFVPVMAACCPCSQRRGGARPINAKWKFNKSKILNITKVDFIYPHTMDV